MEDKNLIYWNKQISGKDDITPKNNEWISNYDEYLMKDPSVPVIELGIGWGNDTALLLSKGLTVKGCDFSPESIKIIEKFYPQVEVKLHNLRDGVPYEDNSANVVLGDLSLHYFVRKDLFNILDGIKRVLKPGGVLLCRVNSANATNYGMGEGEELEDHVFDTTSGTKMFFNEDVIKEVFKDWDILHMEEYTVGRFEKPKLLWEVALKVRK